MNSKFLNDKKAQQNSMSTIYMILVGAIVVVVLIAVIKPMFKQSVSVGSKQAVEAPTN